MKAEDLRAMQAPLKERYRARARGRGGHAEGARATSARASPARCETGRALVEAGLHPADRRRRALACSGDMLLEALVACAGVTLKAVATALGIALRAAHVRAEGDLDFRGTLGVDQGGAGRLPRIDSASTSIPTRARSSSPRCCS